MRVNSRRSRALIVTLAIGLVILAVLSAGCEPEDYQKPIRQFQDASKVVISATEALLKNMNTIEQNHEVDQRIFEKRDLNLPEINKLEIISPTEIKIRTNALHALAQYTTNLAELAQGKPAASVGDSTAKLGTSLDQLAEDAKSLQVTRSFFDNNPRFGGALSSAGSAIGMVAQLMMKNKARRVIEQSIVDNDPAVTQLLDLIGEDANAAYQRQKNALGYFGTIASKAYQDELGRNPDPVELLNFAVMIKAYRAQVAQLADPSNAISKMRKAHDALVACVKSHKNPTAISELNSAVMDFVNAVRPLAAI